MTHPIVRTGSRWMLRALAGLGALLLVLMASSPWTVPAWLRRELPRLGAEQLGRVVRVGDIDFNPLLLELRLHQLQLLDAGGTADALRLQQVGVRLRWSSLWGLHPRLAAIDLRGLRLRVRRDASGRFDFDDMLRRLGRGSPRSSSGTPAFALDDLRLDDAALRYDDELADVHVQLQRMHLHLTRLSTLGGAGGTLSASASALLDGAPVQAQLGGQLFGTNPVVHLQLGLHDLQIAPWTTMQPATLPARLASGALDATLRLDWPLRQPVGPDLSGRLLARDLVVDRAAHPVLHIATAGLDIVSLRPFAHDLRLGMLRIGGVQGRLDRAMLQAPPNTTQARPHAEPDARPAPPPTASPPGAWHVAWAGVQLDDARLQWHDASLAQPLDWNFSVPSLQVGPGQWPLRDALQAHAELQGPHGLHLQARATASASRASAQLELRGLDTRLAWPYAQPLAHGAALPSGRIDADVQARWQAGALHVDLTQALWHEPSWQPRSGRGGPRASLLRLRQARVDWSPAQTTPRVALGEADLEQPSAGDRGQLRAAAVQLRDASLDMQAHRVRVGSLTLLRPQGSVARDSSGRWSVAEWLPPGLLTPADAKSASTASAGRNSGKRASESGSPAWSVEAGSLRVRDGSVYLADTYPAQPVVVVATGIDAELRHAAWPMPAATAFTLQARIRDARQQPDASTGGAGPDSAGAGQLRLQGRLLPRPWRVQASLHAQALPAQLVGDYLPRLNARVLRASADADGQLQLRLDNAGPVVGFDGDAALRDVAVDTVQPAANLMGWRTLQLQALRVRLDPAAQPPTRIDIGKVLLQQFQARLALSSDARLNVAEVLRPAGSAPAPAAGASAPAAPVPAASRPAQAAPARSALRLRVGGIQLDGGRVEWSDQFVRPHYSASLRDVHGRIGAFASDSPALADVDLRAVAEGTAPVAMSGKVNPLLSPPQLDLQGRVDELQMAPLSPYSQRYAGYGIERGLLSMNVRYSIDAGGALRADNHLVLRQLTFGPHVDSPGATRLPVLLAVDLLKDRDGNIDLDIPISGSLKDPQFSLGAVIAQAIGKLLLRAITAPFSLMAHLLEGGAPPPQLNVVPFPPGSARPSPQDASRLSDIAHLLKAKPQLIVTITGTACPASEARDYREQVLERQLLAQWRRNLPRAEAYAHAKDMRVPADAREQALAALYRDTSLPGKPRDALGLARSVPAQTMESLLLQAIPGDDEHLQGLAMRRAVALRDALNALGVPALRQFIAAPELASAGTCEPGARLSVSLP